RDRLVYAGQGAPAGLVHRALVHECPVRDLVGRASGRHLHVEGPSVPFLDHLPRAGGDRWTAHRLNGIERNVHAPIRCDGSDHVLAEGPKPGKLDDDRTEEVSIFEAFDVPYRLVVDRPIGAWRIRAPRDRLKILGRNVPVRTTPLAKPGPLRSVLLRGATGR